MYGIFENEEIIVFVISPYSFKNSITSSLSPLTHIYTTTLLHFSPPLENRASCGFCYLLSLIHFPFKPLSQAFVFITPLELLFSRLLMTITLQTFLAIFSSILLGLPSAFETSLFFSSSVFFTYLLKLHFQFTSFLSKLKLYFFWYYIYNRSDMRK